MMTSMRRLAAPAILAGVALMLGSACGGGEPADTPRPARESVSALTAVAETSAVSDPAVLTGTVEARAEVFPGTKIMGRIESVLVDVGQRVRRGELLATLEKRDLEAAVDQAHAGIAMAEAQLTNAKTHYERIVDLHSRGSVTSKNLEDATAGYRVAQAALEQARSALAAAQVNLAYAEIRSPLDGYVTQKMVEAGDVARPGMPFFKLEDLAKVKVTVQVPESDIVELSEGDTAVIRVDALGREFDSVIDRIVPSGETASRTYEVQMVVDNGEAHLKPGMFARALLGQRERQVLTVPVSALVERGQLDGVFVVDDDGVARIRWVRLGPVTGTRVEILSGIEPGERFVVQPPPGLVDGTPIA